MLGLRLLNAMVLEANSPTPHRTLTQHRKVAVGFRDAALYKVRLRQAMRTRGWW